MASLAARYAMLAPQMKPFSSALFKAQREYYGNHAVKRTVPDDAKCDVMMWRAFLSLLHLDAMGCARSLHSFRPNPPCVLIESDASLFGAGIGVSVRDKASGAYRLACYTHLVFQFEAHGDSSLQNTCEYLGILLGLLLIKLTGCVEPGFS